MAHSSLGNPVLYTDLSDITCQACYLNICSFIIYFYHLALSFFCASCVFVFFFLTGHPEACTSDISSIQWGYCPIAGAVVDGARACLFVGRPEHGISGDHCCSEIPFSLAWDCDRPSFRVWPRGGTAGVLVVERLWTDGEDVNHLLLCSQTLHHQDPCSASSWPHMETGSLSPRLNCRGSRSSGGPQR